MKFVRDKAAISEIVIGQLRERQVNTEFNIETALKTWWQNPRLGGGLRLTSIGNRVFLMAELEHYRIPLEFRNIKTWTEAVLILDRQLPCPYYIDNPKKPELIIYDSRVLVLINMYGNLEEFLSSRL